MRPDQLGDFRLPSDIQGHPFQNKVVFGVSQMDFEADRYVKTLWMWNGLDTFPISDGPGDTSPRYSVDGTLAYLHAAHNDEPQQLAIRGSDGSPTVLTDFACGVAEFAWSWDGTHIAAVVPNYIDGFESDEERIRSPRRIADPAFRYDDKSWTYNKRSHIWLIDVATNQARQLTSGRWSETHPAWNPDDDSISYLTSTDPRHWINPVGHIATVDAATGSTTVRTPVGTWQWCGYAPDGSLLVAGSIGDRITLDLAQFHHVESDGTLTPLTHLEHHLVEAGQAGSATSPRPTGRERVVCLVEDRGAQSVAAVTDDSVEMLVTGRRVVTGFADRTELSEIMVTVSTPTEPGEIHRIVDGTESILSDLNTEFTSQADLAEPHEFTFESDGAPVHGWVYLPEGDEKVPLLFHIHGGPAAQYTWGFFDEFQVAVGAGYGVVAVNPRGSSGYGYDHVVANLGSWSDEVPPDHLDLSRAPYEAAKQFSRLDTDRMGIMGGSYGGLATVMVTSMDQNYRSAVAERGVYNWVSFAGTSDIPWFVELYLDDSMPHGVDTLWAGSTLSRAHTVTTPTLVIHAEDDFRCPLEQGQQLFTLLYTNGVETELLLFPHGEGHEMSRSGSPRHRVDRFEAILDWHARHINGR